MEFELLYWHWIIIGILLCLSEIALPSFTMLWFGLGALVVSAILFIAPALSPTIQLLIWALVSSLLTIIWFKYVKPLAIDKTKAGLSREAILGEVGQVLTPPSEGRRGMLRFPAPILGSDEWQIICDEKLEIGERVRVIDLLGNSLIVSKHNNSSINTIQGNQS